MFSWFHRDGRMVEKAIALFICWLLGPVSATAAIKIATIGDSITQGIGSSDQFTKSYPADLGNIMGSAYQVRNEGNSGKTAMKCPTCDTYWNTSQFADTKTFQPDIAVVLLGTNDINVWNWQYKSEFVADYSALIDTIKNLASHPTVYCCLPPASFRTTDVTMYFDSRILEVIPLIIQVAQAKNACMIDLHGLTKDHPEYICSDSLHPNDSGYAVIARLVKSTILGQTACWTPQVTLAGATHDVGTVSLRRSSVSVRRSGIAIQSAGKNVFDVRGRALRP